MRLLALVLAGLSSLAGSVALAGALPGQPDPVHGKALAQSLCSNCHLVAPDQEHANADVPSFREIANLPGQTTGDIIARIMLPKHPMPEIPLTKGELADLAAYIISLRDQP
ncbi:cytochrome c [Methyloceanibacter sp.]|uniref:c-type cytochrome n=1 Tax=Methyloceanibacter sp. TaxID=1965321 RepID=UPI002D293DE8|nr:cytochrome c [Methyloceanibacter sp.]HZP09622.1 cytochrome c [Methyloceanibacter sp.]